jgi:hypothetical protein
MTTYEYRTRSILTALCLLAAALAATIVVLMAMSADPAKAAVPGTTITVNTTVDESNTRAVVIMSGPAASRSRNA